LIFKVL